MGVPAPKTEEDTTAHALFSTVALTVKVSVRLHLAATNLRFVSIVVTLCHLHRSCTEALDRHSLLNLILCVIGEGRTSLCTAGLSDKPFSHVFYSR